jgi:hypothetical protein
LKYFFFIIFLGHYAYGQTGMSKSQEPKFIAADYYLGRPISPSENFPKLERKGSYFVRFGKKQQGEDEWEYRLKYPETGITIGVTDFGNTTYAGYAYTLMPYISFNLFGQERLEGFVSMGAGWINQKYHPTRNPYNEATTTYLNWACRVFASFKIIDSPGIDWSLRAGYSHYSNGHSRLPNLGYNTVFAGTSIEVSTNKTKQERWRKTAAFKKHTHFFLEIRNGLGHHVLSRNFNKKLPVYSIAISGGKTFNNTLKIGVGFYGRHYEHYYNYINNNEHLIENDYAQFQNNPQRYSKAFGAFGSAEILMNHISIIANLGVNIYKPFFEVERKVGAYYEYYTLEGDKRIVSDYGNLDGDYTLKRYISSRLGLRFYLLPTKKQTVWNAYTSATINANAGQADFNEFSIGICYNNII